MLMQILIHTPAWVWLLLLALLGLGASQLRDREIPAPRLLLLPLVLMALGLSSMRAGFAAHPAAISAWLVAVMAMAWAAHRWPLTAGARWLPESRRLHVPGSALPLLLIVVIFGMRYTLGVAQALHPAWRTAPEVVWPSVLLYGSISGLLLGRAWALWRLTRAGAAVLAEARAIPVATPVARA